MTRAESRRSKSRGWAVLLWAAALALFPLALAPLAGQAKDTNCPAQVPAPDSVDSYASIVYGAGVHVIELTNAYPNFTSGAADNHYPLSNAKQDITPSAQGRGTFSDQGPAGTAVLGAGGANNKVPTAQATCPGGPSNSHVDDGSPQPQSYSDAQATEFSSDDSSSYAGGSNCGCTGATSETHTLLTTVGASPVLTAWGHSHTSDFSQAGGAVKVSSVDITVKVHSTGGVATIDQLDISGGKAFINGQQQDLNGQGSGGSVCPSQIPGTTPGCQNVQVYAVAPEKTIQGNHVIVRAAGTHVVITQPPAGGKENQVEYILGEVQIDVYLTPKIDLPVVGSIDTGGTIVPGGFDASGYTGAPPPLPAAAPSYPSSGYQQTIGNPTPKPQTVLLATDKKPLAKLFLAWEALVMGTAAAWFIARHAATSG
jgi:hypothetical protein